MNVDPGQVPLAWTGIESLENKLARPRDVEQREIFRGRPYKDQIIVLGIVQSEECTALYMQWAVKNAKNAVELVNRQDLSNSGVVIEDKGAFVRGRFEIAHPG